jgi:hypothetical protein
MAMYYVDALVLHALICQQWIWVETSNGHPLRADE